MKSIFNILILGSLFLTGSLAYACKDWELKIDKQPPPGGNGTQSALMVCQSGKWDGPTGAELWVIMDQYVNFHDREFADAFARKMSAGEYSSALELADAFKTVPSDMAVWISDEVDGKPDPALTEMLNNFVRKSRESKGGRPALLAISMSPEKLGEFAGSNQKLFDKLSVGGDCTELAREMRTVQVGFEDGETKNILPKSVQSLGKGEYLIEFYDGGVTEGAPVPVNRKLVVRGGAVNWIGTDGKSNPLRSQALATEPSSQQACAIQKSLYSSSSESGASSAK